MGDVERVDVAGAAKLAGLPRWRLRLLAATRRFPRSDHRDAAGRRSWDPDNVRRWVESTS